MRVHLVQLDSVWEDRAASRERTLRLIDSLSAGAGIAPGDMVLLPEMFETGFSFNIERTADVEGTSRGFVRDLAKRLRATVVAGLTVLDETGKGRNRAVVFGPGGELLAEYDKNFLFPLGERSEASLLQAGNGVTTFEWRAGAGEAIGGLRVGPLICYDLRFPELFGRVLAAGAEAIALIANWPAGRAHHWRSLAIARAIECQAFVFAVNRSGRDPMLEYLGGSMVISPKGEVMAEADAREQVLTVEIDRRELDHWRRVFPAWRDRLAAM